MSNYDQAREAAQKAYKAELAKIKKKEAADKQRLDAKIVEVLAGEYPDTHAKVMAKAKQQLDDEAAKRRERGRAAAAARRNKTDVDPSEDACLDLGEPDGDYQTWDAPGQSGAGGDHQYPQHGA